MELSELEQQAAGLVPVAVDDIELEPLPQQSKVYYSGTTLVVESEPTGNLETAINALREERIREFGTGSENPV